MKRSFILLGIFFLSLMAGACRDGSIFPIDPSTGHHPKDSIPTVTSPIPAEFIGRQWDLMTIEFIGSGTFILPVQQFTLTFNDGSHLSGLADCNKYNAGYATKSPDGISISDLVATKIACVADDGAPEYMEGLRTAISFRIANNTLRIYYDSGRKVLNYNLHAAVISDSGSTKKLTIGQIKGVQWVLSTFESIPGHLVGARTQDPVPDDQRFTLQFEGNGTNTLTGSANCNTYSATFGEGTNYSLGISAVSSTKALCGVQADLQQRYYDALQGAVSYLATIEDGQMMLRIYYDSGHAVLNFLQVTPLPGAASPLKSHFGEKWRLTGYGPTVGAITNPVTYDGRTLFITFVDDHTLVGNAYCSSFTGEYSLHDYIGISMVDLNWPATTICQENEAFMKDALTSMTFYEVDNNTLHIYYHGKSDMLYFVKE
ncbi:MAG: protein of unknown function Meta and HslJ [Chlorobi bacterium]|nr:protein of unknown function Meta and HslJ [Chlorobiota bacterium]